MHNIYRRKLFSNFASLTIIQGTNFLLPILVMPYVIKKIGTDGFGIVAVAQVVMIYLATISDYGFNLTATRDIALYKGDRQKLSRIFFVVLSTKIVITILAFVVLLLMAIMVPILNQNFLVYLFGFVYVVGQSLLVSWIFQGMEKMQYITILTLLARIVFVILVFVFIKNREDTSLFLFFLGIGNVLAGLLSIYIAIRMFKLDFILPLWSDITYELKEGWQITVSNLSISTYLYINIIILRLFTNDLIIGYYSIAEKIFLAMRQVLGIFSQVIYPRICQLSRKSKEHLVRFFKEIYLPFLLCVIAGCCIVFVFSSQIIFIFLGYHSGLSVFLLRMLSFVPVIVCLNIPAYQVLLAFNQKRSYLRILSLGTFINIIANLLLCNVWGASGTVISIIITELFITIGLIRELYKNKLEDFIKPEAI